MFCPLCQSEFREGYTQCSDCKAMLVPSLESDETRQESVRLILDTPDEQMFNESIAVLNDAGIPHHPLEISRVALYPDLQKPTFKIFVLNSDFDRANALLREHFSFDEWERGDFALPASDEPEKDADDSAAQKEIPEKWNPADADVDIWSGNEERFVFSLRDCLRENAIPLRLVLLEPGNATLYVRPEDESRARDILREIMEGTPLT